MPPKATTSTRQPLSALKTNSLIPSFFTPNKDTMPPATVVDMDGIEELSESDFTAQDLARSAQRRKDREAARAWRSRARCSPHLLTTGTCSALASDEVEHIDLSGHSSPPSHCRSSRRSQPASTPATNPPSSQSKRRRQVVSSDEDVPSTRKRKDKANEVPTSSSSARDTSTNVADEPDEYDQYYDMDYSTWDAIEVPDFSEMPSTFPHRSPSPSLVDEEEQAESEAMPTMSDLKLVDDLDHRWKEFYMDHWRRGAEDESDEGGSDHETFGGVAAVAQKRGSVRGRGKTKSRGRGRGFYKRKK